MPPSNRPSGTHPSDPGEETRIKVAVLETRLDAIEQTVKDTKSELTDQIAQLGADLGGLATKEEVRHLSAEVAGVRSSVDRLIGACKRSSQCAPTEPMPRKRDNGATTKDEGDITVKALFWNIVIAGLKLIGAGIVVALIILAINSKFFRSDQSLSTFDPGTSSRPAYSAPIDAGAHPPAPSSSHARSSP